MKPFALFQQSERGASEVAGAAMLIGLVGTAMVLTLVIGGAALDQAEGQNDQQQASTILQEMDSRFSSLSASGDTPQMSFDLGETNPSDFRLNNSGYLNVTVNDRAACTANITMSSLVHERNGATVGYEAGGVWESDASAGSTMLTSPSVRYTAGTIDIHVVNVTGHVNAAGNSAEYDVAQSRARSLAHSQQLFQGDCARPSNVTLQVQSDYYRAWESYLETEFGASATSFETNRTARITLESADLPDRVDDSRNNVINLSGNAYTSVTLTGNSIEVDKGAGNLYSVAVTPLTGQEPNIGRISDIEDATNITRTPLDVTFVLDESGSMGNYDGDGQTRATEAQNAAKGFLGELNASMDRAGAVSFDTNAQYQVTNGWTGHYLTDDFDALNNTLEGIGANGGTESQDGIEYGNNVFALDSNETRKQVMVLLTDGVNNDCQDPWTAQPLPETNDDQPYNCGGSGTDNKESRELADEAAANGVTIYTIGYGDDSEIDQAFLKDIATRTGGEYNQATNSDELDEVFEDIVEEISRTQTIALSPVSSNYTSASGNVYAPQAAGNLDHVAQYSINGQDFANINDPTAGSQFTHSFAVTDGESVQMEAYDYDCDEWRGTGRSKRGPDGEVYNVVRCTEVVSAGTLSPDGIYYDGDNVAPLLEENDGWWQRDINATFDLHKEITVNRTSGPNFGDISMESNQALVYWDLPDGSESANRLLMLYEIGLSEEDADTSGVINVQVSSVEVNE